MISLIYGIFNIKKALSIPKDKIWSYSSVTGKTEYYKDYYMHNYVMDPIKFGLTVIAIMTILFFNHT